MTKRPRLRPAPAGFSLTEMLISMAILGILTVPVTLYLRGTATSLTKGNVEAASAQEVRLALVDIEHHLSGANEITDAPITGPNARRRIDFIVDSYMRPDYREDANPDGDDDGHNGGPFTNDNDPDDDNDAHLLDVTAPPAPGAPWTIGLDLLDDSDDGDTRVDMQVRYRWGGLGSDLVRSYNVNEAGWGLERTILKQVTAFELRYSGSVTQSLGANIDVGDDGTPATSDAGERDGRISEREMDWTLPAQSGHGNRSDALDQPMERRYITAIEIYVAQDKNRDGKADADLRAQIAPVLMPLKFEGRNP